MTNPAWEESLREAFLLSSVCYGSILVFTGKGRREKGGGRESKIIAHCVVVVQAFPLCKKTSMQQQISTCDEKHITSA